MDDGQKLPDVVGAVGENLTFEQFLSHRGLGAEIHEHTLILHLARIARASCIHRNGLMDRLFLGC